MSARLAYFKIGDAAAQYKLVERSSLSDPGTLVQKGNAGKESRTRH